MDPNKSLAEIPEYVIIEDETLTKAAEWWYDHINLNNYPKFTDLNYKDMENNSKFLFEKSDAILERKILTDKEIFIECLVKWWKNPPFYVKYFSLSGIITLSGTDYSCSHEPFKTALKSIGIKNISFALPYKTNMYMYPGLVKVNEEIIFSNPEIKEPLLKIWKQIYLSENNGLIKTTCGSMFITDLPFLKKEEVLSHLKN